MKYWLDTEFVADGTTLDLVSVGIVTEDGRSFYGVNGEADLSRANDWVKANVLPHLHIQDTYHAHDIRANLLNLVGDDAEPEFWGWCCGPDYAVLCLFFGLENWPKGWPYYFHDIQQLADDAGVLLNERDQEGQADQHNALADARWIRKLWHRITETLG